VRLVAQHGGNGTTYLTQCIFANDSEGNTSRGQVFLGTGKNQDVIRKVNGTRKNIGRHVGDDGQTHMQVFVQFRTKNGIVGAIVEIIGILRHFVVLGNIGIIVSLGGSDNIHFTKKFTFLDGIACPCTGIKKRGFFLHKVIRSHAELHAGATAQENHLEVFGYGQYFLDHCAGLITDSHKLLAPVRDLQDRQASTGKVKDSFSSFLNGVFAQDRRPGGKIVFFHKRKIEGCLV